MMKRIAIIAILAVALPFFAKAKESAIILVMKPLAPVEIEGTRKCPVCGVGLPGAVIDGDKALDVLDKAILAKLADPSACRFIFPDEGKERLSLDIADERAELLKIAESRGAEYILYPVLMRYRERQGSTYAVNKPASVVFHVHLLSADDLSAKWNSVYSEEQQAVLQNLFGAKKAAKRGFKWVTAERLVADGVERVFKDFTLCGGVAQ